MKFPVHRLQPLLVDMRVNLRGRNIRVAEHFLDNSQVRAIAEQMRRKTMAEKVGINIRLQARSAARAAFTICQRRTVVSFVPRRERKISLPLRRFTSFGRSVEI